MASPQILAAKQAQAARDQADAMQKMAAELAEVKAQLAEVLAILRPAATEPEPQPAEKPAGKSK
jgi:hypothetical protein